MSGEWTVLLIILCLTWSCRPICVAEHLSPFLPQHPAMPNPTAQGIEAVSAAPFGSSSIHIISWAYIKMLGGRGLVDSSKIALLSANYMASRLQGHYSLRYKNENGRVAHELLIDLAEFDKAAGLKVADFAKRLQVCRIFQSCISAYAWTGLWLPPSDMLLAYLDLHADRAYRVRDVGGA